MKSLKFKHLRITFIDEKSVEFSSALIDHIETIADSNDFIVKLFYIILDDETNSHTERYVFNIESIKLIEQRWKKVEKDDN